MLRVKTCADCLQPTNKQVNLISDESILVVVLYELLFWYPCPDQPAAVSYWWRLDWDQQHAQQDGRWEDEVKRVIIPEGGRGRGRGPGQEKVVEEKINNGYIAMTRIFDL